MHRRTVEERLTALEEAMDPQTIKNSLERCWDPRAGAVRIVDADGVTLDEAQTIQLMGGTATTDAQAQRIIYTPTPPTTSLVANFSDDAVTTNDERIRFVEETNPLLNRYTVDTTSSTGRRIVTTSLGEVLPVAATDPQVTDVWSVLSSRTSAIRTSRKAGTTAATGLDKQATLVVDAQNNSVSASMNATDNSGIATASVECGNSFSESSGVFNAHVAGASTGELTLSSSTLTGKTFALASVAASAVASRTLLNQDTEANYMQTDQAVGNPLPARRVMRGPYLVVVTALAAGATQLTALANARNTAATDYVVMGGPNGAAGSELLQWSWVSSGTAAVDINITNTGAGALTATMRFYIVSTS